MCEFGGWRDPSLLRTIRKSKPKRQVNDLKYLPAKDYLYTNEFH